ncbi:MAG: hypothetical protein U9Q23_01935 [Candidatus Bipolaricaulota bacterium]|nr:hypothetical protein [Candidatus Bipolaricaulota bacterium]
MNSQNLILIGIGLFVGLFVGVAALEHHLLDEHDPATPSGLIWRAKTAFSRIDDLETVLDITDNDQASEPVRVLVQYLNGPEQALSVKYLQPTQMSGELFTVERDLLSHYLPAENLVIVKRWLGLPMAAVGLASFDLTQLEEEYKAGEVNLRVVQEVAGFNRDLFPSQIDIAETLAGNKAPTPFSIGRIDNEPVGILPGFADVGEPPTMSVIQGNYVLEVRDSETDELVRMVWVDRENFMVRKVVFFSDGQRARSIRAERITLNQGLTAEEILALPRGAETVRV